MFILILVFVLGVWVGYKYPQQVDQFVQTSKRTFNDLKDKFSKKTPQD